jgi:hypothetical protein
MTERRFDFDGRPTRREALDAIRAALADEGLQLGTPGQSARVREVVAGDQLRVYVPEILVVTRCGHAADASCRRCR